MFCGSQARPFLPEPGKPLPLSSGAPSQIHYHFKLPKEGCITNSVSHLMIKEASVFSNGKIFMVSNGSMHFASHWNAFQICQSDCIFKEEIFSAIKSHVDNWLDLIPFILTLNIYNQNIFKSQFKIMRRFYGHGLDWKLLCSYIQYWHCNILPPRSDYEAHKK